MHTSKMHAHSYTHKIFSLKKIHGLVLYIKGSYRKQYVCIIHLILENIMSFGTSVNTANQTNDILQYPMDNKFIMYCSCVDAIVTIAMAM